MSPWTWRGFWAAWTQPIPSSAPCVGCQGSGREHHPFSGREKPCHICGGRGLTSPPVYGITACDACGGDGKKGIYEFEHMSMDCSKCGGHGEIVSRAAWDPLPRKARLRTWLREGDHP